MSSKRKALSFSLDDAPAASVIPISQKAATGKPAEAKPAEPAEVKAQMNVRIPDKTKYLATNFAAQKRRDLWEIVDKALLEYMEKHKDDQPSR